MAEGWARALRGDVIEACSAGTRASKLSRLAVQVMAEAGVDISSHRSKVVDEVMEIPFDYVITVCGDAHEACPVFPGKARVMHVGFEDPPRLAAAAGASSDDEALPHYRRVRDQIKQFVLSLPERLPALEMIDTNASAHTRKETR